MLNFYFISILSSFIIQNILQLIVRLHMSIMYAENSHDENIMNVIKFRKKQQLIFFYYYEELFVKMSKAFYISPYISICEMFVYGKLLITFFYSKSRQMNHKKFLLENL